MPFGKVIWTAGMFSTTCGGSSIKSARKSKSFLHFLGFLALATLPVSSSISAYVRSPITPPPVTRKNYAPLLALTLWDISTWKLRFYSNDCSFIHKE